MYSREIDDEVLTLASSGWTYEDTFVLYDHQTESMWYHLLGQNQLTCIAGEYADSTLGELSSSFIRWNMWKADHPATGYMKYPR